MIKENELVLLYREKKKSYLVEAKRRKFNTDQGIIELEEILSKNWGETIKTHKGFTFYVLKPTLEDLIMRSVKRRTQIIYPKDASLIIISSGIKPGDKVIEVGTGSGAFTIALAYFLRPEGMVYSYEKRKEFLDNARKNIERSGLSKYVALKHKEVKDEFDEKDVDFAMLDLPTPWELLPAAKKALKNGSRCASILPTINQVEKFVFALQDEGFVNIKTVECLVRKILVRKNMTRPEQLMHSHTGFIILATKAGS